VQWEPSCSMRTDGQTDRQTDMTELIIAFGNFANSPKRVVIDGYYPSFFITMRCPI